MIKFLVLVGASASGKTTLAKTLLKLFPEHFKTVPSCTTRAPRETDHEYKYIVSGEFEALEECNHFAWTVHLDQGSYGTRIDDLIISAESNKIGVLILSLKTALAFKKMLIDGLNIKPEEIFVLYIWSNEDLRRKRMQDRGETDEFIASRLANEHVGKIAWDQWMGHPDNQFANHFLANNCCLEAMKTKLCKIIKENIL